MTPNLRPYQIEGVAKMVRFLRETGAVYNASEMGLGKTVQTIRTIEQLEPHELLGVLIICPAVVQGVWKEEIKKWHTYGAEFRIISYDKAAKDKACKELIQFRAHVLVLDEAHYLKNPKAKRTQAILKEIWPKIPYKICLSGTPFTQSIMDCWPIFSRICPEEFGDYWAFAHKYCKIAETPWGKKFYGVKNHEKLREIINKKFFFRYLKADVEKELPEKIFQKIPLGPEYRIELSDDEKVEQERYVKLLQEAIVRGYRTPVPPKALATRRQEQALKKLPPILDWCKNILDNGEPLVLFFWHMAVGEYLQEKLKGYDPQVIAGKTTQEKRKLAVESFQDGKSNLFLGQLLASGVGITLTRGSVVGLIEVDYSPAVVEQAISRCHRIGTKKTVNIYWFSVQGSIDEKIEEILLEKSTIFKKVLAV